MPDPNNIVIDNTVIFCQAKVANTAIKTAFLGEHENVHKVRTVDYVSACEAFEMKDHIKATFVRNPWDRLVSAYHDKVAGGPRNVKTQYPDVKLTGNMSFAYFVRAVAAIKDRDIDLHFRPQLNNILCAGRVAVDFIGHFETMPESWSMFCRMAGWKQIPLPRCNESHHGDYRTYYTDELAEIVAERYRRDIEYFGYAFDRKTA